MKSVGAFLGLVIVIGLIVAGGFSAFIVNQSEQVLVLQFGEPVSIYKEPGLYWRIPFVQTVEHYDKRILGIEVDEKEVIVSDQKRLTLDAYARYRIVDPLQFYKSFRTDDAARPRLVSFVDSTLRNVLGRATLIDVVRNRREELMQQAMRQVSEEVSKFGIKIIDVRIISADLPAENSKAIFERMKSDRKQEAQELRSSGKAEAESIKATADRTVVVIEAEANRDAQRVKGEGDAERNHIYAEAFNRDPEFFAFYRSMQAYEEAFTKGNGSTRIVLSPNSEFFRYFQQPGGAKQTPTPAPQR